MPSGQGAVRLVGDSAYAVVAIPVSALSSFDDNHDGLIDPAEINTHRASLDEQISRMLLLSNGGQLGKLIFSDLLLSHVGDGMAKASDNVVAVRRFQWPGAVDSLQLHADFFEAPATADSQLVMRVLKGSDTDATIMSRHRTDYRFFSGTWHTFMSFVATGMEHILLGADHLMFLLTVLVVGMGWRYWLSVITSFTVAHSITLTLAALDIVKVPATVVEPLIAASIVLLAIDNLRRGQSATRHRVPLVFACGLLHGLGIASALTEAGLTEGHRTLGLLGFNLGVELGQMLFVVALLALVWLVRRTFRVDLQEKVVLACSLVAAFAGAGWMVQRLI
ncbi:MAG TPA: HupE/UreJ family protein [Noviherbaspirillum sp.]